MKHWQSDPFQDKIIAYQCLDAGGYIPYGNIGGRPSGGRHVMDDFGNLIQALPINYYQDTASTPSIDWYNEPFFAR